MLSLTSQSNPGPDDFPSELQGLRMTKQRREVLAVILAKRDHPTANDIFSRAQERMPTISLATVYNCLDALVSHGLVRQVNFERESSRYCPDTADHGHFQDEATGEIHDVAFKKGVDLADVLDLPPGTEVKHLELSLRGRLGSVKS